MILKSRKKRKSSNGSKWFNYLFAVGEFESVGNCCFPVRRVYPGEYSDQPTAKRSVYLIGQIMGKGWYDVTASEMTHQSSSRDKRLIRL